MFVFIKGWCLPSLSGYLTLSFNVTYPQSLKSQTKKRSECTLLASTYSSYVGLPDTFLSQKLRVYFAPEASVSAVLSPPPRRPGYPTHCTEKTEKTEKTQGPGWLGRAGLQAARRRSLPCFLWSHLSTSKVMG